VLVLRVSEVINDFKIVVQGRTIYAGRAVVRSLVNAGSGVVCEVALGETGWRDVGLTINGQSNAGVREAFATFIEEQQSLYKIKPDFKLAVADMQSFLTDLRGWCDQIELNVRSQPSGEHERYEREALEAMREPVLTTLANHFERFETITAGIEPELRPAHNRYAKRQLHPLVLCAPFMYRTFQKPLGYAGDYEMVNMMMRDRFQGPSTFAKILNAFFLSTPPVVAHQNRVEYMVGMLTREILRVQREGRDAKIFNVGCGPAQEIQQFLSKSNFPVRPDFTLLDFNEETLQHVQGVLNDIKRRYAPQASLNFVKKSVHHLLKGAARGGGEASGKKYDLVYCAGLFDYLSNNVCRQLVSIMYEWLAPGGLLMVTNVDSNNPSQGWMEYVVDWHLFYRNVKEMRSLAPSHVTEDCIHILAEPTGLNTILELRRPENV
jgi:extracellular factor (EF) 3-hydroxypalmitic acid methyl ester biosynthesis protein